MIGSRNLFAALGVSLAMAVSAQAGDPMDEFAWSARPVLVFAASETDPLALDQLERLNAEREALRERDMVVITLWPDRSEVDGQTSALSSILLRKRYAIWPDRFALLLVGKDTGIKHRAVVPVDPSELFEKVDAMPMRQREMRAD